MLKMNLHLMDNSIDTKHDALTNSIKKIDDIKGTLVVTFDIVISYRPIRATEQYAIDALSYYILMNSSVRDDICYFGSTGSKTTFTLIIYSDYTMDDIQTIYDETNKLIKATFQTIVDMQQSDIPKELGNIDLDGAKAVLKQYLNEVI